MPDPTRTAPPGGSELYGGAYQEGYTRGYEEAQLESQIIVPVDERVIKRIAKVPSGLEMEKRAKRHTKRYVRAYEEGYCEGYKDSANDLHAEKKLGDKYQAEDRRGMSPNEKKVAVKTAKKDAIKARKDATKNKSRINVIPNEDPDKRLDDRPDVN